MKKQFLIWLLAMAALSGQAQLQTILVGDTVELRVNGHHGTVQWQQSTDSLTWADMAGLTDSIEVFIASSSPSDKRFYRAKITDVLCPNSSPFYSTIIRHRIITATTQLAIGDWFGGGIVFYTDGAGHGLIAAPSDQSSGVKWGCFDTSILGAVSTTDGAANTTAIVANCATRPIAASICDELNLNGLTDWFLPAKDQLNQMYLNKIYINGFASDYYWSSSEGSAINAWRQAFGSGAQASSSKNLNLDVRCVRSF